MNSIIGSSVLIVGGVRCQNAVLSIPFMIKMGLSLAPSPTGQTCTLLRGAGWFALIMQPTMSPTLKSVSLSSIEPLNSILLCKFLITLLNLSHCIITYFSIVGISLSINASLNICFKKIETVSGLFERSKLILDIGICERKCRDKYQEDKNRSARVSLVTAAGAYLSSGLVIIAKPLMCVNLAQGGDV